MILSHVTSVIYSQAQDTRNALSFLVQMFRKCFSLRTSFLGLTVGYQYDNVDQMDNNVSWTTIHQYRSEILGPAVFVKESKTLTQDGTLWDQPWQYDSISWEELIKI